jgi:hypothetical protein
VNAEAWMSAEFSRLSNGPLEHQVLAYGLATGGVEVVVLFVLDAACFDATGLAARLAAGLGVPADRVAVHAYDTRKKYRRALNTYNAE